MPSWGEILQEVADSARERNGQPDLDGIRRKYLEQLHELTGRPTIVYATNYLRMSGAPVAITLADMQGMMEVCRGIPGPNLDVILHSPGGELEAAASIVRYLRKKFTHIRAFVPLAAMSAATMWALACNEIYMGKHSQLGPIDPQFVTQQGQFPARGVMEQFERAKRECAADPSVIGAWLPILQQYGPALLDQCEKADLLARRLVAEWLVEYMLQGKEGAEDKAAAIAGWFADYGATQSHALGIDREAARSQGVNIIDLEADQDLQDAVLSVHHATMHTFENPVAKLVENHEGRAFVQIQQVMQVQVPVPMVPGLQPGGVPPEGQPGTPEGTPTL